MWTPCGLHQTSCGLHFFIVDSTRLHVESIRSPSGLRQFYAESVESTRNRWRRVKYWKYSTELRLPLIKILRLDQQGHWALWSLSRTPKPSWVEVVDAVIDDAHRPNTFFRPPPEASHGEGPMTLVAAYKCPLKPLDLELDLTQCISNFNPPIQFSYTEQQLYNVHVGVVDSDFDDNIAHHNQLQAEILSVNILSEVGEELESISDLLCPWMYVGYMNHM
ncbi:hypothetical protein BDZ97DRAFT_1768499 [Flammula alnicola]|nr:hypothetical protein BDZ97DRAFT_1768499 [Flammula alnicola]